MSNEHDTLRVLYTQYDRVHFLFNRTQCSSSLFASDVVPLRSQRRYLRELIEVDAGKALFFDLNRFLSDIFHTKTESGAQLALVSKIDLFSDAAQQWLTSKVFAQVAKLRVLTDRVAFRIPSNTQMKTLPVDELTSHSPVIQDRLVAHGIYALHPTETSLGFFIDIERLLVSRLLFLSTQKHEESR